MSKMIHGEMIRAGWHVSALGLFAVACSGETVDLGEVSRDLEASVSQCQDSALVAGDVVVQNQEQLDALAGCEEIDGNLYVRPFAEADFTPLASLTKVGGALEIGRQTAYDPQPVPVEDEQSINELIDREAALLAAGCFSSLEGFESLASAGSLALTGLSVPDLASFSSLSALTNGGALSIDQCSGLASLTGLEGLRGVVELTLNCDDLESLAGPRFAARMGDIYIRAANLSDLGALSPESVKDLRIEDSAIVDLDAFSNLRFAAGIDFFGNASLQNADALDSLFVVGTLRIANSPSIARLPDLVGLVELDTLSILGNDALTSIPTIPNLGLVSGNTDWGNLAPGDALRVRPDVIEINSNASLESIAIPSGWLAASYIDITANQSLTRIDLASVHAADGLYIAANPALDTVNLGRLETVDDLRVIDNPLLPLEPFAAVQTFRRIVQSGPLQPDQY